MSKRRFGEYFGRRARACAGGARPTALRRAASAGLRSFALLAACILAGCAQTHLTQAPDEAIARVGAYDSYDEHLAARDYLGHYAEYAILAAHGKDVIAPDFAPVAAGAFKGPDGEDMSARAARWQRPWRYVRGADGPFCKEGETSGCGIPGAAYQVWRKGTDASCSEIAIVFRGTDVGSLGDWLSNLHWVTRALPVRDQYEQVQDVIKGIVSKALELPCRTRATRVVAIGHSLGGGLAQQAAYVDKRIRRVYAFDPSPVTGSSDQHSRYDETRFGLRIERVYEHGEMLAYGRYFVRQLIPGSACNPLIRTFRIDLIHGNPIFQHYMVDLAGAILVHAGEPGDPRHRKPLPPSAAQLAKMCGDAPQPRVAGR